MRLFRFVAIAAMSFVMVGALAAQTPQQQPPVSPRPEQAPAPRVEQPAAQPAAQAREATEITIVGCLAQGPDAADAYTLTVAPAAPAADAAAPASAGANTPPDAVRASGSARSDAARTANASESPAAKPATYKITGIAADQLKPHVNHHVEIKGRVAAAAGQADAAAAKEFRGSSVKMLNATCPAAQ